MGGELPSISGCIGRTLGGVARANHLQSAAGIDCGSCELLQCPAFLGFTWECYIHTKNTAYLRWAILMVL